VEQLVFELTPPEPPRLANFLPGRNAELIAALTNFVGGAGSEAGLLIWGAPGAGKTHLLNAAAALGRERGIEVWLSATPEAVPDAPGIEPGALFIVDRVDEAGPAAAGHIFTLYNALREHGGRLLAASRLPLASLPLREDLRTRLGWGLVYEILPLADEDKPEALKVYARRRGLDLPAEVVDYLLRHGRRDMQSLLSTLSALDRVSLATKRPITVPLLREWLQKEIEWGRAQPAPAPRD
jgi:DnaA family protein